MKFARYILLILVLLAGAFHTIGCDEEAPFQVDHFISTGSYDGAYWPTASWRSCAPEEVGVNAQRLYEVYNYMTRSSVNTYGIAIIKDGYIIAEEYFDGYNSSSRFKSYSVAKSFASLILGVAIEQGYLSINDPIYQYLPQLQEDGTDPLKKQITVKHVLTMTTGLEWDEAYSDGYEQSDLYRMTVSDDFLEYVLAKDMEYPPGTDWYYSTGTSMIISGLIQYTTGKTALQYGRDEILGDIGVGGIRWDSDPAGRTIGGWGVWATVREYARFGYLFLKRGEWNGEQLISREWVNASSSDPFSWLTWYGYQWWLAPALDDSNSYTAPSNAYAAEGIYGQMIIILPSDNIIIVRCGMDPTPERGEWSIARLIQLVRDSLE